MTEKHRKVVLYAGLCLLFFHFVFVGWYVSPFSRKHYPAFVLTYVSSFFHQNWLLFAPPPSENYYLFAFYAQGDSLKKTEILGPLISAHERNRLAGHEAILTSFVNHIHYFEKTTTQRYPLNGPVKGDRNFEMLRHSLAGYLKYLYGKDARLQRCVLYVAPLNEKGRVYFD